MEIKPKSLKIFCCLVETGSVTQTASVLSLTASAVSKKNAELELLYGFPLFKRDNRHFQPTPAAIELYKRSKDALEVWRDIENYSPKSENSEPFRICILARHAKNLVPPLTKELIQRYSDSFNLHIDVQNHRDLYYSKLAHPFDIGFGCLLSEHHDLEIEVLCHVPFVAYGKELFGHAKQKLNPEDLDHHRLILLSSDTKMGTRSQRILKEVHYQRAVTVSSTDLALELANENLGIHITDALAAPFSSEYMRPIEGELTIPFCAFWLKRSLIKHEHEICLHLMKEIALGQLKRKGLVI